jgi:hypothetical protein
VFFLKATNQWEVELDGKSEFSVHLSSIRRGVT